jgi:hypothetical protein
VFSTKGRAGSGGQKQKGTRKCSGAGGEGAAGKGHVRIGRAFRLWRGSVLREFHRKRITSRLEEALLQMAHLRLNSKCEAGCAQLWPEPLAMNGQAV